MDSQFIEMLMRLVLKNNKIEDSVRSFSSNIKEADNKIYIDDKGKAILDSNNGWIQIIDANNNEVYSYKKPSYIKNKTYCCRNSKFT